MASVIHIDVPWLLQRHEEVLPEQPTVNDFSALVAAVARHRVDPPKLGVDSDPAWRAAALLHTLALLRPLPVGQRPLRLRDGGGVHVHQRGRHRSAVRRARRPRPRSDSTARRTCTARRTGCGPGRYRLCGRSARGRRPRAGGTGPAAVSRRRAAVLRGASEEVAASSQLHWPVRRGGVRRPPRARVSHGAHGVEIRRGRTQSGLDGFQMARSCPGAEFGPADRHCVKRSVASARRLVVRDLVVQR